MRLQTELIASGQRAGEFHPGDPTVLAHLFSGLVASYQAMDPSIVSDERDAPREAFAGRSSPAGTTGIRGLKHFSSSRPPFDGRPYDRMPMDEGLVGAECVDGWPAFRDRRSSSGVPEEARTAGRL